MDYQGQKLAELLLMRLIIALAAISFIVGYALGDFSLMCYVNAAGLALVCLVVLPDWPFFNRNGVRWLGALKPEAGDKKS